MQLFHKFITSGLCVAQHVSGVEAPETCWATHKTSSNKLVKQMRLVG